MAESTTRLRKRKRLQLTTDNRAVGALILVCGLPGSGKTTVAKRFEAERNAVRMCPDDWIEALLEDPKNSTEKDRLRDAVENLQWDLAKQYLSKGLIRGADFGRDRLL